MRLAEQGPGFCKLGTGDYANGLVGDVAGTVTVRLTRNFGELIAEERLNGLGQVVTFDLAELATHFEIECQRAGRGSLRQLDNAVDQHFPIMIDRSTVSR